MAAWTPADLGASLLGWFDGADAASVVVSGSGVSAWTNKGASTFTLTQGLDAYKPTYAANAVTFADNSSQYLAAGSPPAAYDFFIVGKPTSFNDWRNLFLSVSGTSTENTILIEANTGRYGVYGSAFDPAGGLTWADSTSGLSYGRISAAGPITLSRDGGALVSTGVNHAAIPLEGVGSSGSYQTHSYTQAFGAIYELIFVPYNSSDDTRQKLEGYAAWKWGLQALLPSDHPYKSAAPVSVVGAGSVYGKKAYGKAQYSRAPVDDLAGDLAPVITFSASLSVTAATALAGDLSPSVTFAGDLTFIESLAGDLTPVVTFSADITITAATALAGDLAPAVTLAGDLTITAATSLAGDLAPSVTFAAALTSIELFAGDLAPVVTFVGDLDIGGAPDLAGNLAPVVTFAGDLTTTDLLAGDLAPSVAFAGALTSLFSLTGDLAPSVMFAGDLTTAGATALAGDLAPSVTFAGDLANLFSLTGDLAPLVALSADLTVTPAVEFAGDLTPIVSFAGDLSVVSVYDFAGDLALDVVFAADLTVMVIHDLAGDLPLQVDLGASLGGDWLLSGDMSLEVDLAAELTSGPLWDASDGCPVQEWEESELCPPPLWTPTVPPSWAPSGSQDALGYGMGAYGMGKYNQFMSPWESSGSVPPVTWAPSSPATDVEWDETELCDG